MSPSHIEEQATYLIQSKNSVQSLIQGSDAKFSIYFQKLGSQERWVIQPNRVYNPASVIKVLVLFAVFQAIEENRFSLSSKYPLKSSQLRVGSGVLNQSNVEIVYSLKDYLYMMISLSDNTATAVLIDLLGLEYIQSLCDDFGLHQTKIGTSDLLNANGLNQTTANDVAMLLKGILFDGWINEAQQKLTFKILTQQKYNWGIPKYLPDSALVAHKTGSLQLVSHDVGLVRIDNQDYLLVILSEGPNAYLFNREKIANISKEIFNAIEQ